MLPTRVLSDVRSGSLASLFVVFGLLSIFGFQKTVLGEMHHRPSEPTQTADGHMRLGMDFFLTAELDKAIDEFRAATHQQPGYAEAYHNLGVSMAKAGNLAGAIEAWAQAKRVAPYRVSVKYPISALVAFNYGVSRLLDGKPLEARQQWIDALGIHAHFPEAHYALGLTFLIEEDPIRAIGYFKAALRWAPDWSEALQALGLAYFEAHEYEWAQEAWSRALEIQPNASRTMAYLGLLELEKGNFQESIHHSRQALMIQKDLASAHFNLGLALFLKGELRECLDSFKAALSYDSGLTKARLVLGVAWSRLGHWVFASQVWQEALTLDPFHRDAVWAHYNLGLANKVMGQWPTATKEFRWVVNHWPEWAPGWSQLGTALMAERRWGPAESSLQTAIRLKPDRVHLHMALGTVHIERGKFEAAEAAFVRATEVAPNFSDALFQLAVVRRAQNRPKEAMDPLHRAALRGHRESQALLASMYVNGRGTDRSLPLAMLWWARSSRNSIPDEVTDISKAQLSLLRRGLHRGIFSDQQRQDVLKGFALIRRDLRSVAPWSDSKVGSAIERLRKHDLRGSFHRLPVIIERALAFDETARSLLREHYQMTESVLPKDAEQIHEYFLLTAKEGDPYSCDVLRKTRLVAFQPLKKSCMKAKP